MMCTCDSYRHHLYNPCYGPNFQRTKWKDEHEKPPRVIMEAELIVNQAPMPIDTLNRMIRDGYK